MTIDQIAMFYGACTRRKIGARLDFIYDIRAGMAAESVALYDLLGKMEVASGRK